MDKVGDTPLIELKRSMPRSAEFCEMLGVEELTVKDESTNPTRTFKDRICENLVLGARATLRARICAASNREIYWHPLGHPLRHVDLTADGLWRFETARGTIVKGKEAHDSRYFGLNTEEIDSIRATFSEEATQDFLAMEYTSGNAIRALAGAIARHGCSRHTTYALVGDDLDPQIRKSIWRRAPVPIFPIPCDFREQITGLREWRAVVPMADDDIGRTLDIFENSTASIIFELIEAAKFPDHIFVPLGSGHLARTITMFSSALYLLRAFRESLGKYYPEEKVKMIMRVVIHDLYHKNVERFPMASFHTFGSDGDDRMVTRFFENMNPSIHEEGVYLSAWDALDARTDGYTYKPEIHMVTEMGTNGFLDPMLPEENTGRERDCWTVHTDRTSTSKLTSHFTGMEYSLEPERRLVKETCPWMLPVLACEPRWTERDVKTGVADKLFVPKLEREVAKWKDMHQILGEKPLSKHPIHIYRVSGNDVLTAWRGATKAGIHCEPSAAIGFAGVKEAIRRGTTGDILVISTGDGLYVNPDTGVLHEPV